jgi:hypothetical protein
MMIIDTYIVFQGKMPLIPKRLKGANTYIRKIPRAEKDTKNPRVEG